MYRDIDFSRLLAGADDGEPGLLPFLLVWLIVCVAGFALLRGGAAAAKQPR